MNGRGDENIASFLERRSDRINAEIERFIEAAEGEE